MELADFIRNLFNSTFKTNPFLERALMTGITRISKESIFSDLNNLTVITATSDAYADCFGFTEQEVWETLAEYSLSEEKNKVKDWYDGFAYGRRTDIYNPWSIINYLKTEKLSCYWANTSSNSLVDKLIREGNPDVKEAMEGLLKGGRLYPEIDEQIIFSLSYFDSGNRPSGIEPERFYHGFVLGLMVELADCYVITSNRESGYGRYDVMLKPLRKEDDAIIMEFKVHDPEDERDLKETVNAALNQIVAMNYKTILIAEGISENRIRSYGVGFEGKRILIG